MLLCDVLKATHCVPSPFYPHATNTNNTTRIRFHAALASGFGATRSRAVASKPVN